MNKPPPLVPGARALLISMSLQVPFQGFPNCLTAHQAARASIASGGQVGADGKPAEMGGRDREVHHPLCEGGSMGLTPETWLPWFPMSRLLLSLGGL